MQRLVLPYEWTAHPAKARPHQLGLVAMVVLFSAWAIMVSLGSAFLAALGAVIIIVAVSAFLFPTHYRLDVEGVHERRLFGRRARRWPDLRRVQIGPGAALVSPFRQPNWLDRYRGVVLYLDGADRARVRAILQAQVTAAATEPA